MQRDRHWTGVLCSEDNTTDQTQNTPAIRTELINCLCQASCWQSLLVCFSRMLDSPSLQDSNNQTMYEAQAATFTKLEAPVAPVHAPMYYVTPFWQKFEDPARVLYIPLQLYKYTFLGVKANKTNIPYSKATTHCLTDCVSPPCLTTTHLSISCSAE